MAQDNSKNAEQQASQDTYTYGLGNPNVQYTAVPWDVFWSLLVMVVVSLGMLIGFYDLSLGGFEDWFLSMFNMS